MRNYLSEALREEDEAIAKIEADKAILEIQNNIEDLLSSTFNS
jgi:hypothetical protein